MFCSGTCITGIDQCKAAGHLNQALDFGEYGNGEEWDSRKELGKIVRSIGVWEMRADPCKKCNFDFNNLSRGNCSPNFPNFSNILHIFILIYPLPASISEQSTSCEANCFTIFDFVSPAAFFDHTSCMEKISLSK